MAIRLSNSLSTPYSLANLANNSSRSEEVTRIGVGVGVGIWVGVGGIGVEAGEGEIVGVVITPRVLAWTPLARGLKITEWFLEDKTYEIPTLHVIKRNKNVKNIIFIFTN